jgi:hypothetical protein
MKILMSTNLELRQNGKTPRKYNEPKLTHRKIEILGSPISTEELKSCKHIRSRWLCKVLLAMQGRNLSNTVKILPGNRNKKETLQLSNWYKTSTTLIAETDKTSVRIGLGV